MKYQIWSDGSCLGNPGPGGAGFIIRDELGSEIEQYFHEPQTTNNRMELTSAILAISSLPAGSEIELITDSNYVGLGITEWMKNWKAKNWKTANKKEVKNKDLWQLFDSLQGSYTITFTWVKGHSSDPMNDRVDALAKKGSYNQ